MTNQYNFHNFFLLQKELDSEIASTHNVTYETTFNKRVLALLVELGEFANETRAFKYWSFKAPSPKEIILDEYADALHFFLSLGLAIGIEDFSYSLSDKKDDLSNHILEVYEEVITFNNKRDKDSYFKAFSSFLSLLPSLGYDFKDMEEAYNQKMAINHQRVENHY